jgi:ferrochelatase
MPFDPEPQYRHGSRAGVAVLLVNLGTPDAPTAPALKRYLRQFLSDPRVVEIPKPLWWLILNGLILNIRPKKSAAKYQTVWTPEGSPLKVHTARQATLLQGYLGERLKAPILVDFAMRYGNPSIRETLSRLRERGADRVLVVPLYPQAASSTTGSTLDAVTDALRRVRNVPALRFVRSFHDHPLYIHALAESVREHWAAHGRAEKLVMSFHGLPRFHLEKGDPYHCECHKTGRLLAEALGLGPDQWIVTFQSRFGRAEWLKPYTQETLESIARAGVRSVDTVCPGFVSDCLETLEEIALENRAAFLAAGGREFRYIPCLNERHAWIEALSRIVEDNLQGWLGSDTDGEAADCARQASRARALAMGAAD